MVENEEEKRDKLGQVEEDENPERGNWSGDFDFLFSCIGYAVGLGNIWRFPYLCFKHGGGAFLLLHTVMLFLVGIPCFFLEISIGQYSGLGPVTLFSNLVPLFKGLGFTTFVASAIVSVYYNVLMAWIIYYIFASLNSELPWNTCDHDYNTDFCFNVNGYHDCVNLRKTNESYEDAFYHMGKCITEGDENFDHIMGNLTYFYHCTTRLNETGLFINNTECVKDDLRVKRFRKPFDIPPSIRESSASQFFTKRVLAESDGIHHLGSIQGPVALCLAGAWVIIFACMNKGIKTSGKVVYFTATFPYLVLVIVLIRAATLPGAVDGIWFYLIPDWSRLQSAEVWDAAAGQIFFTLSCGGGGLITLASYNKYHNRVIRDTLIVCLTNCFTSVLAGFCIFSALGFLAKELGVEVKDVVASGTNLAFVAYPDLVSRLPISPFWSVLFFIMLFTLGLDSVFGIVEVLLSGVLDYRPDYRPKKTLVIAVICLVCFLCGLPLTTSGGGYIVDLLDFYAPDWPYLFVGLMEFLMVSYIYGINNWLDDLEVMCDIKFKAAVRTLFIIVFKFMSPIILAIILFGSWIQYTPLTKGGYVYPAWANSIGWLIAMIPILGMPFMAVYQLSLAIWKDPSSDPMTEKLRKALDALTNSTSKWRLNAKRAEVRDGIPFQPSGITNNGFASETSEPCSQAASDALDAENGGS